MDNLAQILPWWLLGAPLVFGLIDWMRTPRASADRHHSSMGHAGTVGTADTMRR